MGRFHMCMPVAERDGYCCAVCHRDMNWEMSQYAVEASASPWGADASPGTDDDDGILHGCVTPDSPRDTWHT